MRRLIPALLALTCLPSCGFAYRWVKHDDGQRLDERIEMVNTRLEARPCDGHKEGEEMFLDAPFNLAVASLGFNDQVLYRMYRVDKQGRPTDLDHDAYAIVWNGRTRPTPDDRVRQEVQKAAPPRDRENGDTPVTFAMAAGTPTCQELRVRLQGPAMPVAEAAPPPAAAPAADSAPLSRSSSTAQAPLSSSTGQTVQAAPTPPQTRAARDLGIHANQVSLITDVFRIPVDKLAQFRPLELHGLTGPGSYPMTLTTTRTSMQVGDEYVIEFLAVQRNGREVPVVNEVYRSQVRIRPIQNNNYLGALIGTAFVALVFITGLAL
jgi:hypothetical protein